MTGGELVCDISFEDTKSCRLLGGQLIMLFDCNHAVQGFSINSSTLIKSLEDLFLFK